MRISTLFLMLFALLAPMSTQAFYVPDTSVNVPTLPDTKVPDLVIEDPADFSCEAEVMTETAANGQNKAYVALSYISHKEVESISYDLVAKVGDETLFNLQGLAALEVTGEGNTNMFESGTTDRKLLVISGTDIKEKLFPVYQGTEVKVTAKIDGNNCTTKSVSVIDGLTCAIDGKVKLLGDGMNELTFTTFMDVDDDRNSVPFTLSIKSENETLLAEKGITNLSGDGIYFVTKNGEATRSIMINPNDHDNIRLSASLGGHSCAGVAVSTIQRSSIVDTILNMNREEDSLIDAEPTKLPEVGDVVGTDEPASPEMESDEMPTDDEGEVDSGEAAAPAGSEGSAAGEGAEDGDMPEADVVAAGEEGEGSDVSEGSEEVLTPELLEEILESAPEDADLSDKEEVEAIVAAYFENLGEGEGLTIEAVEEDSSEVATADEAAEAEEEKESSTDKYLMTLLYIAIAVFVIFIGLFLALMMRGGKKENMPKAKEDAEKEEK